MSLRAVGVRLQDLHEPGPERHPGALHRLAREVGRRDAPQRPLAEHRHDRLLVGLAAHPALVLEAAA